MGNRITKLRRAAGISQRELGERLRVGQTTVSAWELGRNEPDWRSIVAMAEMFGVSEKYLMGDSDTPKPDPEPEKIAPMDWKTLINYAMIGVAQVYGIAKDSETPMETDVLIARMQELITLKGKKIEI